jgi:hypothetical protein
LHISARNNKDILQMLTRCNNGTWRPERGGYERTDYYLNDQNECTRTSPPHYSTQDSKLIRHTIAGLIGFVSDDLRNEWSQQADPHIVVGDQITGDYYLEKCDCAVEIAMIPPLITLWTTRRLLVDSPSPCCCCPPTKTTDPDRKEN